ncbi:MAG TPA: site-specific DNA-methyltransferase [Candidatus Acidoferrales bacterium]|nr:site-specific DNA-methyltransferase [Candidatus Acidoferrales bacterium]
MKQSAIDWTKHAFDVLPLMEGGARPNYTTKKGALFQADCLKILPTIKNEVIDTVFADPPFNIGKKYGDKTNDKLPDDVYISWCKEWLKECVRVLKPGGSLFVYNLPKWNIQIGAHLNDLGMEFRHWISIEISACLPIPGRLHPSHYSLLYYSKGKPNTFRRIRTPILRCRHCGGEIKDYGGHRDAMNPKGVTLKDVWTDIPPVRHWKYKSRKRTANALSTKILDRVIEMSTLPCDLVLDPFGGSGTTFVVCESKERHWIGIEIDYGKAIIERLETDHVQSHKNHDFIED